MRPNLNSALAAVTTVFAAKFNRKTKHLHSVQNRVLSDVLGELSGTAWGSHLGLREDWNAKEFRTRVHIQNYSDFAPFAQRLAMGEQGVASKNPVQYLAVTSGTTGERKMYPVTRKTHAARQRAAMAAAGFLVKAVHKRGLPVGRVHTASSAAMIGETEGGVAFGFTCACERLMNRSKFRGHAVTSVPFDVLTLPNYSQRTLLCFLFAVRDRDLRFVSGNFSSSLIVQALTLANETPMILQMLRQGGLPEHLEIPDNMRQRLLARLTADTARADELERLMDDRGILTPAMVWPDLSAVITSVGEGSLHQTPTIRKHFNDLPIYGATYSSTEGMVSIHTDLDETSGTLAIESGFFEFIPEEEWEAETPQTLLPHEVEVGREYRIVITNMHGLCRRDLGDIIRVTGWHNQTPRITFVRRNKGVLSSGHEKTLESHIDQALETASATLNVTFSDVGVTLEESATLPSYLWLIELEDEEISLDLQNLAEALDKALGAANRDYHVWRDGRIAPPKVALLPKGCINHFLGRPQGTATDFRDKTTRILQGKPDLDRLIAQAVRRS